MNDSFLHPDKAAQPKVVNSAFSNTLKAILSQQQAQSDTFYLTGYETISFNQSRNFSIETILDSVVPFEREILIISKQKELYTQWTKKHNVNAMIIEQSETEDLSFRLFLQPEISHVIITIDTSNHKEIENLKEFALICESEKVELIVDCIGATLDFKTMQLINAGYFICEDSKDASTIIAKRSRLVQTEGMSRSFAYDLYGYWQKAILFRGHSIEPMAV